jgi:hypothetical protein
MADNPNRVELEYGATVNRGEMQAAKDEAVRNASETSRAVSQAAKPPNVANAEAASAAAAGREAQAQAAQRAEEATRRLHAEQDRLYQSVSRVNDRSLELAASFGRLTNSRFGDSVNRQASIAEAQLVRLRAQSQAFRKTLEDPSSGADVLQRIAPQAARAETRIEQLTRRLRDLEREGARSERDPFDLGDAAGRAGAGGGGRGGVSPFMARRVAMVGAQALGLPAISGSIGGLEVMGGGLAALGLGLGAVAGIRELIKLSNEAETSQFNLAASAHNTGRSFLAAREDSEAFREALGVTRDDANTLAAALSELKLRAGGTLPANAADRLSVLARAQGLEPKDAASAISGLAKGSGEAFEQLTGSRADITLDRYARSVGTTTSRLTDMTKVQVLANAALQQATELQQLASQRADSLSAKTATLGNRLKDFGAEYGKAFFEGVILNKSSAESEAERFKELGVNLNPTAEQQAAIIAAGARRTDERNSRVRQEQEAARQQELRISQEEFFKDEARGARAVPEDANRGLSATQSAEAAIEKLRARRKALQEEFEHFQKLRSQFSTDDAEKFNDQFLTSIQSLTDEIRGRIEALANEARGQVQSLARDVQNSTEEFARLRLPTDEANPYVKLFSEGERALESYRQRFALLTDEQRASFAEQIRAAQDAKRYDLEVRDSMSAVRLEFEAAELAKPFEELTGEMKRALSVFNAGLVAATRNPQLEAQAALLRRSGQIEQRDAFGFIGNNQSQVGLFRNPNFVGPVKINPLTGQAEENTSFVQGQEFRRLLELQSRFGGTPGLGGEQIRNQVNVALSNLFGQINPRDREQIFRARPDVRERFAQSFEGQADFNTRQLERAARIAEAGAPSLRLAETQLQELNRLGAQGDANRPRTRAEFLAITGAIPREELTPELTAGRIGALREEASFKAASEERAAKAFEETRAFQRGLIGENGQGGVLNLMLREIKNRNESVLIEVTNKSERATVSTLGGGFQ